MRKLRVNKSNRKAMKCTRMLDDRRLNIVLNAELLEKNFCHYLGSHIAVDGGINVEVRSRMIKGRNQ